MRETTYFVTVRGRSLPVTVRDEAGVAVALFDGRRYEVDLKRMPGTPLWSLLIDNHAHKAILMRDGDRWLVGLDGVSDLVEIGTERDLVMKKFAPPKARKSGLEVVSSPMPGLVIAIRVKEGDVVPAGASVATVEAMKMENEFKTAHGGVVTKIHAAPGQTVAKGAPLVSLKAGESAP